MVVTIVLVKLMECIPLTTQDETNIYATVWYYCSADFHCCPEQSASASVQFHPFDGYFLVWCSALL